MRSRLLLLVLASLGASLGAACAQGSTFNGGGGNAVGGQSGSSSGSTGGTGGGSSSGASSSGHTSSSTTSSSGSSSTSSSSSSGACSQSPCKPTSPQCGCPSGEACTITNYALACGTAGTSAPGAGCQSATACEAGSICVDGVCDNFCASDSDCTGGGICALQLSNGSGGAISGVLLCSNTCDLSTNSGCPTGTACQISQEQSGQMRFFTFCDTAGTATAGATCDGVTTFCAPTYGCFNNGSGETCAQYCYVGAGNACAGCSALSDTTTSGSITVNNKTVGACP
jgi:hypothetical protein